MSASGWHQDCEVWERLRPSSRSVVSSIFQRIARFSLIDFAPRGPKFKDVQSGIGVGLCQDDQSDTQQNTHSKCHDAHDRCKWDRKEQRGLTPDERTGQKNAAADKYGDAEDAKCHIWSAMQRLGPPKPDRVASDMPQHAVVPGAQHHHQHWNTDAYDLEQKSPGDPSRAMLTSR